MKKNNRRMLVICILLIMVAASFVALKYYMDLREERNKPAGTDGSEWSVGKCADCGKKTLCLVNSETGVKFFAHRNSRVDEITVYLTNSEGDERNLTMFRQNAGYDNYSTYLRKHGCSTCALTTILRAYSEKFSEATPDEVIETAIRKTAGDYVFNRNFGRPMRGQMPVTLCGMTAIFDKYGISYSRPTTDPKKYKKELTKHLKSGNPAIITIGNGSAYGLSRVTHTILLLGIDDDGYVVIGDSLHKDPTYWGRDGLIKHGKITAGEMVDLIKRESGWTVQDPNADVSRHFFYHGSVDRGYLLINSQ